MFVRYDNIHKLIDIPNNIHIYMELILLYYFVINVIPFISNSVWFVDGGIWGMEDRRVGRIEMEEISN